MSKSNEDAFTSCVTGLLAIAFVIPLTVLFIAGAAVAEGFVLMQLWSWFIVPVFNLPLLTLVTAIGLSLTVSLVVHSPDMRVIPGETTSLWKLVGNAFIRPAIMLGIGYVVFKFFM